jgi:hypothetical protein
LIRFLAISDLQDRFNLKLGPFNCMGLTPNVTRYVLATAIEVRNQN